MTHFRFRYETRGGHVHIRVFAGPSADTTHGKCGDLCMTVAEFEDFKDLRADVDFVPETEPVA